MSQTVPATAAAFLRGARAAILLLVIAATAVVTPMFFLGNASGHDFQFHLASWLDVAGQWREGIVFPRWAEWANWGYGEPRFVFYPPASWTLGAALGSILPWKMAPGAFIWLAIVLAGISMWKFAREWVPEREATMAAVLYAVNPYHLVVAYYRSDFAELLASALFPLALWGAFRVVRNGWRNLPSLAIPFAAIWLSDAPAAVLATYSLVLMLCVMCVLRRSVRPLLTGGSSIVVGLGLAAFYILPAAWEQRWVQIRQALADLLRPEQNFLFTHARDPEFLFFNWKVSAIALGVVLGSALAAVFVARRQRELSEGWWVPFAIGCAAIFCMFPPSVFLWRLLPKLEFVQFPWRWLGPLGSVMAFFVAVAVGRVKRQWICWLFIVIALGSLGTAIVSDAWWDSEDIPVLRKAIQTGLGYEGTDEYQPLGSDRYQLPGSDRTGEVMANSLAPPIQRVDADSGDIVPVGELPVQIQRWTANRKSFSVQAGAPVTLAVRLLNYPGWRVSVDHELGQVTAAAETAQMLITIPAGARQVRVGFGSTPDRIAGTAISILFAMVLLFMLLGRVSGKTH
ncbi:MAG: 6-pyruvoyl-tetrahydropterin synthase-related protein [Candidatus Acidiferrales bacterium]